MKELAFMIAKALFIPCYSIKCDFIYTCVQYNIIYYIIAFTNNSLSKVTLNEHTNIIANF